MLTLFSFLFFFFSFTGLLLLLLLFSLLWVLCLTMNLASFFFLFKIFFSFFWPCLWFRWTFFFLVLCYSHLHRTRFFFLFFLYKIFMTNKLCNKDMRVILYKLNFLSFHFSLSNQTQMRETKISSISLLFHLLSIFYSLIFLSFQPNDP